MNILDVLSDLVHRCDKFDNGKGQELCWNIVSCLRAYDYYTDLSSLKAYTVGRIRAIIGLSEGSFPGIIINTEPLNQEQRGERDSLLEKVTIHFSTHYKHAVDSILVLYNYDLRNERRVPPRPVKRLG